MADMAEAEELKPKWIELMKAWGLQSFVEAFKGEYRSSTSYYLIFCLYLAICKEVHMHVWCNVIRLGPGEASMVTLSVHVYCTALPGLIAWLRHCIQLFSISMYYGQGRRYLIFTYLIFKLYLIITYLTFKLYLIIMYLTFKLYLIIMYLTYLTGEVKELHKKLCYYFT